MQADDQPRQTGGRPERHNSAHDNDGAEEAQEEGDGAEEGSLGHGEHAGEEKAERGQQVYRI